MDRRAIIAILAGMMLLSSCFDAPPIFNRPIMVYFTLEDCYGVYVSAGEINKTALEQNHGKSQIMPNHELDTIWINRDGTYRQVCYDSTGFKYHDVTDRWDDYVSTVECWWEDPHINVGFNFEFPIGGTDMTYLFFGCGYDSSGYDKHPKGTMYFANDWWFHSPETFHYRKISK